MLSKEYFMYSCPGSNLKSASPGVLCVFEISDNAALAQFLKWNPYMIIKWSRGPSWTEHCASAPAEWFRCCSAAGTSFSNYKFIKSESHQQSLELLFQKYIWLISFSPFLICSLPNIFFFFSFRILTLLAFHSAWPKKPQQNLNNKLKKHTTFILFSDLIPVCSFWVLCFALLCCLLFKI